MIRHKKPEVQSFLEKKTGNLKRLKRLEQLMEKVEGKGARRGVGRRKEFAGR